MGQTVHGRYRVQSIRDIRVRATRSSVARHVRDLTVTRRLMEVARQLVHDVAQMYTARPTNRRITIGEHP